MDGDLPSWPCGRRRRKEEKQREERQGGEEERAPPCIRMLLRSVDMTCGRAAGGHMCSACICQMYNSRATFAAEGGGGRGIN